MAGEVVTKSTKGRYINAKRKRQHTKNSCPRASLHQRGLEALTDLMHKLSSPRKKFQMLPFCRDNLFSQPTPKKGQRYTFFAP